MQTALGIDTGGHSSSAVLMLRHKHIPLAGLACNCNQRLALERLQGS